MVRRVTPSQLKSLLRQAEQKQRQAINKYNQAVRKYNQGVKRAIGDYNREARAHNARVRTNRQGLKNELARLSRSSSTTTRYTMYRSSVRTLHTSYERLEEQAAARRLGARDELILDLSERETENSLSVANALLGDSDQSANPEELASTSVLNELREISADLDRRWRGAVFALDPGNPDAARHFCTSAREIFTQILEIKAPDIEVFKEAPNCTTTDSGKPTRRSKIQFLLSRKGLANDALEDFVEDDMDNIIELFRLFNVGTHGTSGKFTMGQLVAIKRRVEHGILFLHEIVK